MADDKPNVTKLPSKAVLKSLLSQSNTAKGKLDTIKGEIGEKIANAVETHNLHAGAFKLAKKIAGMDAVKALAFLTHFDDYRNKLELDRLAGESLDLDGEGDEPETPGEAMARGAAASDEALAAAQAAAEQKEGAEILDRTTVN